MEFILDALKEYQYIIMLVIVVLLFIFIIMEMLNRVELNRIEKKYKKMMKGSSGKNIEEMILEYKGLVETAIEGSENVKSMYYDVDERLKKSIQKVSIVRYKAFEDVGSDLSFSIALLDDKNNGIVLTGIYGRSECATFAKPIENGISKYDLSEEEKTSIKNAMSK